jgi:hypothetical protein
MNCDLVFEILTRGPFPSGDPTDASVELHLSRCHDCRQLAEALRPAVELFHETLSFEEEAGSLPGYYGALSEAEEPHAKYVVAATPRCKRPTFREARRPRRSRKRFAWDHAGQVAGAMFLGAAICLALAVFVVQTPSLGAWFGRPPHAGPRSHSLTAKPERDPMRVTLASLHLPRSCLAAVDEAPVAVDDPGESGAPFLSARQPAGILLCCTHCHAASQTRGPIVPAVAVLQREACVACHRWD